MTRHISDLPKAVDSGGDLAARTGGKRLAIFLDYDGTLTPIVARPEWAVMDPKMREVVRDLSKRCTVCIVSGRDRPDVEGLVQIEGLIYAGSHGFDIASPDGRSIQREEGAEFYPLLEEIKARLHRELDPIEGSQIEPKKASVAVHYRNIADGERPKVKDLVDDILAKNPQLKVTPGKMVYEIQPKLDWDKGKAVLYLLEALELTGPDVLPMYFGDDHTDEHAFEALKTKDGLNVFVGEPSDPEVAGRTTAADYICHSQDEVAELLSMLGT